MRNAGSKGKHPNDTKGGKTKKKQDKDAKSSHATGQGVAHGEAHHDH